MPICPHCETPTAQLLAPCPSGDGFYSIEEAEYASFQGDRMLGVPISGRYIVTGVIGRGAIGRVYKGRQLGVDRDVVLKIFKVDSLVDEELGYQPGKTVIEAREDARERFIREARVLGQLTHPNCVTLYDFGVSEDETMLYIAMEFVAGMSMREAIQRGLKAPAIMEIMKQTLSALREAHALSIVHRDLKPENIILSFRKESNEPVVKVLDFGIAKLVGKDSSIDRAHTSAGMLFGTPAYMSPEQCRGASDEVGAHSDIYAFGCMCYELVTGHLPYNGRSPQQLIVMHQEAEIPRVHLRTGLDMPQGIEAFLQRCLAKEPKDRYRDAARALRIVEGLEDAWEPRLAHLYEGSDVVHSAEIEALRAATERAEPAPAADRPERHEQSVVETVMGQEAASLQGELPEQRVPPGAMHTMASRQPDSYVAPPRPQERSSPHASLLVALALLMALGGCAILFFVLYQRL